MKLFTKRKQLSFSVVFIVSIIFGLAGGIVGELVADVYLDPWRDAYLIDRAMQVTQTGRRAPELRRLERFLGIEQDFQVNKAIESVSPAVVEVYLKKAVSSSPLGQVYVPKDARGAGVIFTSDGWIVTATNVIGDVKREQLVIVHDGTVHNVEQIIFDALSGIAFVKVNATNLPVAAFGDSDDVLIGQLSVIIQNNQAAVTTLHNAWFHPVNSPTEYVLSTDRYAYRWQFSSDATNVIAGSPVTNLVGDVVAVITGTDTASRRPVAVPINQVRSVSASMLRSGVITRPVMGASYVDISRTPGVSEAVTQGRDRGALVMENPAKTSPAAVAGIKQYDIIVSVDGTLLDGQNDLANLILEYRPGDQVDLEVSRDGKVSVVTVTLGSSK